VIGSLVEACESGSSWLGNSCEAKQS
jgi:hypothetical protein